MRGLHPCPRLPRSLASPAPLAVAPLPRRRTYKYLRGVLAAQRVVTDAWLPACLAAGGPVDEAAYLVSLVAVALV
jgi:hypothetical protein